MHYEQAKELLINGKTREAINKLRAPLENTPLYDEWMMIRARYETLREREMKGLMSTAEAQLEHNKINDAVLRLLDQAEKKEEVPVVQQPPSSTTSSKQGMPKWAGVLIAVVVAVGTLVLIKGQFDTPKESTVAQIEQKKETEPETKPKQEPENVAPENKPSTKPDRVVPETKTMVPPNRSVTEANIKKEAIQAPANLTIDAKKAELIKDLVLEPGPQIAKYDVSKLSGHRELPFEIHTLTHTQNMIFMEMTLTNRTTSNIKLGEMELLHTGDRSVGKSKTLNGTMMEPGDKITDTFKFQWPISGNLRAFRMKMGYTVQGSGIRSLKTDFGLYKRIE